jgi:hypothetical protein
MEEYGYLSFDNEMTLVVELYITLNQMSVVRTKNDLAFSIISMVIINSLLSMSDNWK